MDKVAILTDSAAGIPPDMADELGIDVIPMQIVKDGSAFAMDSEITTEEVYGAMRQGKVLKTTQPLVPHIYSAYEAALRRADKALSIHISSKLTSTFSTCKMVADMIDPERITVVDSGSLTILYGLACIKAARDARAGGDIGSAISVARATLSRIRGWLAVPSLKYLAQSGRVSRILSTLGTLLSIKVILRMGDGEVVLVDKYRSSSFALEKLRDNVVSACTNGAETVCLVHADNLEEARRLGDMVLSSLDCGEVIYTDIGPTIGVHTGPGPFGAAVLPR